MVICKDNTIFSTNKINDYLSDNFICFLGKHSFATPIRCFDNLFIFTFASDSIKHSMKKHLVLLAVLLQATSVSLFAQSKPNAGDVISGIVSDDCGPMMMVNVAERDSMDRIAAHSLTDIGGNFSFRLVNPDHRIEISYVGYENVSVPIDTTYFEIKMKEWDGFSAIDITTDSGSENTGNPVSVRKTSETPTKVKMKLMDQDSWTFQYMQNNAPEGYVCGYIVKNTYCDNIYSLFLIKNGKKYELVKKIRDYQEVRDISRKLARQLEESMNISFTEAEERKEAEAKRASNSNGNGIQVIRFYDGNYIYAIKPGMIGFLESGESTELPDKAWNDEAGKFK